MLTLYEAGVSMAIVLCNFWPAQTFYPLLISVTIQTISFAVLCAAISMHNTGLVNGMMVAIGAGTGASSMPGSLHIAGI